MLIWPLYAAAEAPYIPDVQKRWLRGRLWAIARQYGFEQASILNKMNSNKTETNLREKSSGQRAAATDLQDGLQRDQAEGKWPDFRYPSYLSVLTFC